MQLKRLSLTNFKNIPQATLEFSPKLNCFLGDNGMGKSNLLDAVYYLSFCKSFAGITDAQVINRDHDFAILNADYDRRGVEETLAVGMQRGRRKSFKRGGKEYQRLSQHIGLFPLVLVSPSDTALIDGGSDERRRFIDMVVSQTDSRYLDMLIRYNRALEQRNSMLRNGIIDTALYEALDVTMDAASSYICLVRGRWIQRLEKIFNKYYSLISADAETPGLVYKTHLSDPDTPLSAMLKERLQRDLILKYTTAGPHRDDIEMTMSGMPVKRIASQGQAKSFTIALRLAQYEFLRDAVGMTPILLLDDIFDKLDAHRVERIMQVVASDTFGQILITDTNRKHLDEILTHAGGDYALWSVTDGDFTLLSSQP